MVNDFFKDYSTEDAHQDAVELSAFGLLDANFDLIKFYTDLYSEQIAGYYDDQNKEMYVIQGEGFKGLERMTYAHEYTHALQDQNYDFQKGLKLSDEDCKQDSERCSAIHALLEGDATVAQLQWFAEFATNQDRIDVLGATAGMKSPVYDSAPDFMKQDFLFPYTEGQTFVEALKGRDGWASVDAAFKNPAVSTEQILHPERYPDDQPVKVTLPDLTTSLGNGWNELEQDVVGEWYTYLILAHGIDPKTQLDDKQARQAAEGWGGDAYAVYTNGDKIILILATQWDTENDAAEFTDAFRSYGKARYGRIKADQNGDITWEFSGGYAEFRTISLTTTWVFAPDAETAQAVWTGLK